MSEPICCTVHVKVPSTWQPVDGDGCPSSTANPPPIVTALGEALINGSGPDVEATGDGWVIWSVDGEGNYGLADDEVACALNWLEEQEVPYRACSDTKYDMVGEIVMFDGNRRHHRDGDNDGAIILPEVGYRQLILEHGSGTLELGEAIDRHFTLPDLEACPIDHLPADYPEES